MSQKPEKTPLEQKKHLALVFAGLITFLIFIVWLLFFIGEAKNELNRTSENRGQVFGSFQENMTKFADKFVNQFKNLPEKFIATSTNFSVATSSISTSTQATIENTSTTTESTNQ
ncbi:MAG: hypothetical protein WCF92_03125 [bacterium]